VAAAPARHEREHGGEHHDGERQHRMIARSLIR